MASEVGLGCEHLQGLPYERVKSGDRCGPGRRCQHHGRVYGQAGCAQQHRQGVKGPPGEQVILQGHIRAAWLSGQYTRTRNIEHCKDILRTL